VAFPPSGELLLFRVETKSGQRGPFRDAGYREHPRVGRIRELLDEGRMRTIAEITVFNRHYFGLVTPVDLGYLVADGMTIDGAGEHRAITAFEGKTARPLWSIPVPGGPSTSMALRLDPTGRVLAVGQEQQDAEFTLLEMPGGRRIGVIPANRSLGPEADSWLAEVHPLWSKGTVYSLFRRDEPRAVLTLAPEVVPVSRHAFPFSPDGRRLAWGNSDGTVDVAELDQLRHHMQPIDP
jgi:hypothetical protein